MHAVKSMSQHINKWANSYRSMSCEPSYEWKIFIENTHKKLLDLPFHCRTHSSINYLLDWKWLFFGRLISFQTFSSLGYEEIQFQNRIQNLFKRKHQNAVLCWINFKVLVQTCLRDLWLPVVQKVDWNKELWKEIATSPNRANFMNFITLAMNPCQWTDLAVFSFAPSPYGSCCSRAHFSNLMNCLMYKARIEWRTFVIFMLRVNIFMRFGLKCNR